MPAWERQMPSGSRPGRGLPWLEKASLRRQHLQENFWDREEPAVGQPGRNSPRGGNRMCKTVCDMRKSLTHHPRFTLEETGSER